MKKRNKKQKRGSEASLYSRQSNASITSGFVVVGNARFAAIGNVTFDLGDPVKI